MRKPKKNTSAYLDVVLFIDEKYYAVRKKQTDFFVRASSSIIIVYAVAVKR